MKLILLTKWTQAYVYNKTEITTSLIYSLFLFNLQEELQAMIENKNDANTLYSVLHIKPRPLDANKDEKTFGKKKFTGKLFRSKK